MAWKDSNTMTLSKSILEMKFMKRTKDKVEKQAYQQEGEEYFGSQKLPKQSGQYITEASYAFCEDLIEGRLSFQGENPELERLIELEQLERMEQESPNQEADISDAEMAKSWKSTVKINVKNISQASNTIDSSSSSEPKRKKPKFLKPLD